MKAIIYTGIGLISAAAVYGMADYYGSNKNGSLKTLYHETENVLPETPVQPLHAQDVAQLSIAGEESIETVPLSTTSNAAKKVVKTKRPSIRLENFSREALVPMEVVEPVVAESEPVTIQQGAKPAIVEKEAEATTTEVKLSEKKIDLRMFSRAKPIARKTKGSASKKE